MIAPAFHPGPSVRLLGTVPNSTNLSVVVALAPADPAGLAAAAYLASTPGSPGFRHYLAPSEVAQQFGASAGSYQSAVAYFASHGLSVRTSPDRLFLDVRGPAPRVGASFGTSFDRYLSDGTVFFSHPTPALLPGGIPWAGALGLGNRSGVLPLNSGPFGAAGPIPAHPLVSCGGGEPYYPCQITSGYNFSGLLANGTNGTGVRIGVVDAYSSWENQTSLTTDLGLFTKAIGISVGTVNFVYPVPTARDLNGSVNSAWAYEDALDLEWARGIAPGATVDMTLSPDASAGLYASVDWLVAHHAVDVLSMSWGEPDVGVFNAYSTPCLSSCNATSDGSYALLHPVLQAAAAEGISVVAASGDCGAAWGTSGVSTGYPASDPWATGVGATDLSLTSSNRYTSETAWSGNASGAASPGCQNQGGSGGGYSPFPRPAWQADTGLAPGEAYRGVPDVAIQGGTAVEIVYQGQLNSVWGTSASTPMWAGLAAIGGQLAGTPLGFLDPALYAVARSASGSSAFHDVTSGSNGYPAGTGWDAVTGLGSPNAGVLLPLLARPSWTPSPGSLELLASPRYAAAGENVSFATNASVGTNGTALLDIDFGDGNASLAPSGTATHAFASAGVYVARAVAINGAGNSSISWPVVVVVGGGGGLNVSLSASPTTPAVGGPVGFTVTVRGGAGPYHYSYYYGDGTYWTNTTNPTASHAYPVAAAFCAFVVVTDSAAPADGGAGPGVPIQVGGASGSACPSFPPLRATASAGYSAADMPGDFPIQVSATGGAPPASAHLASDDPYVAACNCAIFRPAETNLGNHTITVYVNDSFDESTVTHVNVTVYPSLVVTFNVSTLVGRAPLTVNVSAIAQAGHLPDANRTSWSFGDGGAGTGASLSHTYAAPGYYTLVGHLSDAGHGNSSEAFLVDVLPAAGGSGLGVTAQVIPAILTSAGYPMQFRAFPTGGTAPYTVRWDLGQNDSAFGATVSQTYTRTDCLGAGTCPLTIHLNVTDATGASVNETLPLTPLFALRWSGLVLSDHLSAARGTTPYLLTGVAVATGVVGASVNWTWGDGNVSTGGTASHLYLLPGNYTVTETAQTTYGDLLIRSHAVVISGQSLGLPTVSGGPTQRWGIAPALVNFSVQASGGQGGPYLYNWTFGDGTIGSGPNVTHAYAAPGRFVANVTVTDRVGAARTVAYPLLIYNVTAVVINASAERGPVSAQATVLIRVLPHCGVDSVPSCSAANVTLGAFWTNATGAPPVTNLSLPDITLSASGWANVTLSLPANPGGYSLALRAIGENYTGSALVPIPAETSSCPQDPAACAGPSGGGLGSLGPLVVLVLGTVAGGAAVIGVAVRSRRDRDA